MKTEEVIAKSDDRPAASANSSFWNRRAVVTTSVILSMLAGSVCIAPMFLTATSQRNRFLESAIGHPELTATAESATGGWFTPIVFHDVRLADTDERFVWTVKEIQTSKGMFSFLIDPVHAGNFKLLESSVRVTLNEKGEWPLQFKPRSSNAELSFQVEKGSLTVIVPWRSVPIVDLESLNVTGSIAPDAAGQRMLTIDPIQVFDHEPVSELHSQQNLALIAPVLSQATTLKGTVSVWLDAIHIPLKDENIPGITAIEEPAMAIRGRAEFHTLEARLKENWTRQLTAVIGQVSGRELPDKIRVLENSTVEFSANQDGIFHEGLVFLLPQLADELTFSSSGLIRLDESLDLLLTLNVPEVVPAGRPLLVMLSRLAAAPIQFRVLGTVSKPQLQLPEGMNLMGELSRRIAPAQYTEEAPAVPSAVIELIQDVGSQNPEQLKQDLPGSILNLIRAVEKQAKEKQSEKKSRRK